MWNTTRTVLSLPARRSGLLGYLGPLFWGKRLCASFPAFFCAKLAKGDGGGILPLMRRLGRAVLYLSCRDIDNELAELERVTRAGKSFRSHDANMALLGEDR